MLSPSRPASFTKKVTVSMLIAAILRMKVNKVVVKDPVKRKEKAKAKAVEKVKAKAKAGEKETEQAKGQHWLLRKRALLIKKKARR